MESVRPARHRKVSNGIRQQQIRVEAYLLGRGEHFGQQVQLRGAEGGLGALGAADLAQRGHHLQHELHEPDGEVR